MDPVFKEPLQVLFKPFHIMFLCCRFLDKEQCTFRIISTLQRLLDRFPCFIGNCNFIDPAIIGR